MATRYAVVELETTDSTQNEARGRCERADPVLVVAGRQTAGRGRLGREWAEADRAMFSSYGFRSAWPPEALSVIPLIAGVVVRSAIEDLTGVTVGLRWPNDLVVPGGKLGGILVESSNGCVVVGCGVNLSWDTPVAGATSLETLTRAPVRAVDLAVAWADRFVAAIDRPPGDWDRETYRAACITIGRRVSYAGGTGTAVGISDDGSLLVETETGVVAVHSGEVRLHDPATLPTDRRD